MLASALQRSEDKNYSCDVVNVNFRTKVVSMLNRVQRFPGTSLMRLLIVHIPRNVSIEFNWLSNIVSLKVKSRCDIEFREKPQMKGFYIATKFIISR